MAVTLSDLAAETPFRTLTQQPAMQQKPATPANQACTSLHYGIDFKSSPQRIDEALLHAKQFTAFSDQSAEIEPTPGGALAPLGGQIVERNVELIANRRIAQAWRSTHWDAGVYSITRFELKPRGRESTLALDPYFKSVSQEKAVALETCKKLLPMPKIKFSRKVC